MKIYLPHIKYTVYVKEFKTPPPQIANAQAWVRRDDMYSSTIFIKKGEKKNTPNIAHEVVHILQFICLDRNIDFCTETEHMGYLMQYFTGEIMGYTWS